MLVNVKIEISECTRITFEGYTCMNLYIFISRAKTKLAMLAFLLSGEFMITRIEDRFDTGCNGHCTMGSCTMWNVKSEPNRFLTTRSN